MANKIPNNTFEGIRVLELRCKRYRREISS